MLSNHGKLSYCEPNDLEAMHFLFDDTYDYVARNGKRITNGQFGDLAHVSFYLIQARLHDLR